MKVWRCTTVMEMFQLLKSLNSKNEWSANFAENKD